MGCQALHDCALLIAAAGSASGASPSRSPPSVQHTRSQLIKEGLKLTLQTKRRHTSGTSGASGASGASGDEDDDSPTSGKRVKRQEVRIRKWTTLHLVYLLSYLYLNI